MASERSCSATVSDCRDFVTMLGGADATRPTGLPGWHFGLFQSGLA